MIVAVVSLDYRPGGGRGGRGGGGGRLAGRSSSDGGDGENVVDLMPVVLAVWRSATASSLYHAVWRDGDKEIASARCVAGQDSTGRGKILTDVENGSNRNRLVRRRDIPERNESACQDHSW